MDRAAKQHMFYALDLEMEQPNNEIISIGVSIQNYGNLNYMITPSQPLSPFIKELTGYDDSMFDWNASREDCLSQFVVDFSRILSSVEKVSGRKFYHEAVTWGQGDVPLLLAEFRKYNINYSDVIRRSCIDVKTLYVMERHQKGLSISNRCGLSSAYRYFKLPDETLFRKHNSADDALMTLMVFEEIIGLNKKRQEIIKLASLL